MTTLDVFGVGNALVDTLVSVDDQFLAEHNIHKGIMTLVNSDEQAKLLHSLEQHKMELRSGGSAANTVIALANCGGTGCYTGKVAKDSNGDFYKQDMEKAGIIYEIPPSPKGSTGTCVVMTTKDAQRTMMTNLGISTNLSKSDINLDKLKISTFSYIEGYLWDGESTREASVFTMESAKQSGKKVAFTYSDPFCVNRYKEDFKKITKELVDVVFCNHEEAMALSETDEPEKAIQSIGDDNTDVFMTWGEKGALVYAKGNVSHIPGFPVQAVDTNGAGDAFAAGVLFALTHDYNLQDAAKWGNYVASRIVLEIGARLSYSLQDRVKEVLK